MPTLGFAELLIVLVLLAFIALIWGGAGLGVAILKLRRGLTRRPEGGAASDTAKRERAPASRARRLSAVLIDAVLISPLVFIASEAGYADTISVNPVGAIALIGFVVLQNLQVYLLATSGQTIGKRALQIRIVDVHTGRHPGWFRLVVLRTLVNRILAGVTIMTYALVDALFIFRNDRRTIHDMMARTRVDYVGD